VTRAILRTHDPVHLLSTEAEAADYWAFRLAGHSEAVCGLPDDPFERWLAIATAVVAWRETATLRTYGVHLSGT